MKNNGLGGFSLIELSIVILVASVFAASSVGFLGKKELSEKNQKTLQRMEFVAKALRLYAVKNSKLPCPASYNSAWTANSFGVQSGSAGTCTGTAGDSSGSTNIVSGNVPFVTLGIPPIYLMDEWSNRITYIVDEDLTNTNASTFPNTVPNIKVLDGENNSLISRYPNKNEVGNTVVDCTDTSNGNVTMNTKIPVCAAFLLISHGPNGYLAYNARGYLNTSATIGGNSMEKKNAPVTSTPAGTTFDNAFLDMPKKQGGSDNASYFDDILVYRPLSYLKN